MGGQKNRKTSDVINGCSLRPGPSVPLYTYVIYKWSRRKLCSLFGEMSQSDKKEYMELHNKFFLWQDGNNPTLAKLILEGMKKKSGFTTFFNQLSKFDQNNYMEFHNVCYLNGPDSQQCELGKDLFRNGRNTLYV